MQEVVVSPPNAILLVVGGKRVAVPKSLVGGIVAATRSCIAVGTRNPADGSVSVLWTADEPVVRDPAFDGFLDSPDHEIRVESVERNECAVVQVKADRTRVRVYADDLTEPTRIAIDVG